MSNIGHNQNEILILITKSSDLQWKHSVEICVYHSESTTRLLGNDYTTIRINVRGLNLKMLANILHVPIHYSILF